MLSTPPARHHAVLFHKCPEPQAFGRHIWDLASLLVAQINPHATDLIVLVVWLVAGLAEQMWLSNKSKFLCLFTLSRLLVCMKCRPPFLPWNSTPVQGSPPSSTHSGISLPPPGSWGPICLPLSCGVVILLVCVCLSHSGSRSISSQLHNSIT